ncbi:MAG: hypothetical protein WC699_02510 [Bacteroidales bacterium]|jgi:hypothetical protein
MSEKIIKTLRFDLQLVKLAEQEAKMENRSFNNWLETLMMRELRFDPSRQYFPNAEDISHPQSSTPPREAK